ncbi:hypothetical protein MMC11_008688 [Xylographa trunciseda]|nr:hypothetical protein [Xylographa trunciseda]
MQALRHLPPRFLLPAWNSGQLTQLRWLQRYSGVCNPQEEDYKRGGKKSVKSSLRKQYNSHRTLTPGAREIHVASNNIQSVLQNSERARSDTQTHRDLRKEHKNYAAGRSITQAKYVRYSGQDDGHRVTTVNVPIKHRPVDGFRSRYLAHRIHLQDASHLPLSRATNSERESPNSVSGVSNPMLFAHSHRPTAEIVSSPELVHDIDQKSGVPQVRKNHKSNNDNKPWGWMSLPLIDEQSRANQKAYQDELPSRPNLASDRSLEQRQMATNISDQGFGRSDGPPLRKTSEKSSLKEEDRDRAKPPLRWSGRINNKVESYIPVRAEISPSRIPQIRNIKSRKEADINQHIPQEGIDFRDKTTHGASSAAEELIYKPVRKELSLLEQLFPEEAKTQSRTSDRRGMTQAELPRLPPPEFDALRESLDDEPGHIQNSSKLKTREATINALRQENPTILLLSRVSTALCDADFRRIVPGGVHIEEWRGPGDILKVIPSRDMSSLSPTSSYYLLFSNPAYARAYQNQVIYLHQLAQTYTPTSLESPMFLTPGVLDTKGQDVYALLQDFAIAPPSVRMSLRVSLPPYHANLQRLLENEGYQQLVQSDNKAGRAVLFWVDGYQPSALSLRTMLAKDGQDRGLQWGPLNGKGEIEVLHVDAENSGGENGENDVTASEDGPGLSEWRDNELKPKKHGHQRWIISFEDEAEARRFVRIWHRRPYSFPLQDESPSQGEPEPLVHAEFLW